MEKPLGKSRIASLLSRRVVHGVPLGVLLLSGLLITGIAASVYVLMFGGLATIQVRVKGVDGLAIQAGLHSAYTTRAPLTSLATQKHMLSDGTVYAEKCALLVVDSYDLDTENLVLSIKVYDGNPDTDGKEVTGWTATPRFVEFCRESGNGKIVPDGAPTNNGDGTWTITNAQIKDMVYKTPAASPSVPVDPNCLLVSFVFDTGYSPDFATVTWYVKLDISVATGS